MKQRRGTIISLLFYKLDAAAKIGKIERIQDVVHSTLTRTVQKVCHREGEMEGGRGTSCSVLKEA